MHVFITCVYASSHGFFLLVCSRFGIAIINQRILLDASKRTTGMYVVWCSCVSVCYSIAAYAAARQSGQVAERARTRRNAQSRFCLENKQVGLVRCGERRRAHGRSDKTV